MLILSIWQFSAFSSRIFPSVPIYTAVDVTIFSLSESIGGLVTCAKSCLKYSNNEGFCFEIGASGVSTPMAAIGSPPFFAIVRIIE